MVRRYITELVVIPEICTKDSAFASMTNFSVFLITLDLIYLRKKYPLLKAENHPYSCPITIVCLFLPSCKTVAMEFWQRR